ncbi:oxidoreductase [Kribbella sp. NPDC058693]|uniref:oxidoreductase n=1 Tax=Kribbella sp. NPDC058693 TaxID=3346602 RepID=UPI00365B450A
MAIADQSGRTVFITGASAGVGRQTAIVLAAAGATVVLGCRDLAKGAAVRDHIRAVTPSARVGVVALDLASLESIREAAKQVCAEHDRIDVLINNAGVMRPPRSTTADGFELQFGTNHLGHFALTGLLLERLLPGAGSRVVTVASPAHRQGRIDFDDLQSERRYRRSAAYAQSKLANLLFTYELQRRLAVAGATTVALAAHPGGARTELNRNLPFLFRGASWGLARPITHPVEIGALSILYAAVDPGALGGEYYGPDGLFEFKGQPTRLESTPRSHDAATQRRLWEVSQQLTDVRYDALAKSR